MDIIFTEKIVPMLMILLSGALVALADGFIKKASLHQESLLAVLRNPLMIYVTAIYIFAVIAFSVAFIKQWDLGIVGIMQIIVYAVAVVVGGVIFFHERLTFTHGIGIALALIAAVLLNI